YAVAKIAGIKLCQSYNFQYGTNFISVMPTNLYGPNDNFDLEKSHVIPALLRKIFLGKCMEEKNWIAVREDLTRRPVEGVDGDNPQSEIIDILKRYGISYQDTNLSENLKQRTTIEIWGTGEPLREFLWSEEMADACVYLMEKIDFKDIILTQPGSDTDSGSNKKSISTLAEIRNTHINIGTGKEISIKSLAELISKTVGFTGNLVFNASKPDGTMRKLTDVTRLHQLGWHHETEIEEGLKKLYHWYLSNNHLS
ncbi:MAG: NAD-dependent epimerase/dehydratase family protein, partial [Mariniphaga sp.]|nr:NAD-dependent epimerase/dehydratase family protein [Mariniphaga sp.]